MSAARPVNHSKFIGFIKIHKGPKTCGWAYGELFAIFNDIIIKVVYIKDKKKKKELRKNIFGNCEMESLIEKYKKKNSCARKKIFKKSQLKLNYRSFNER